MLSMRLATAALAMLAALAMYVAFNSLVAGALRGLAGLGL